ncbi:mitochondrial import receptor subunit TOM40-1-like [Canna indica]|uniref:Mitochondrial import receptor subunit TOM40-1-like n=2 Tax=Magnoliopsida TaxID=3398 RepID=A0AAQ3KDN9_9LILI|nr:mitochondrial import receptor subunit TOM40-1-like [Canna indica]
MGWWYLGNMHTLKIDIRWNPCYGPHPGAGSLGDDIRAGSPLHPGSSLATPTASQSISLSIMASHSLASAFSSSVQPFDATSATRSQVASSLVPASTMQEFTLGAPAVSENFARSFVVCVVSVGNRKLSDHAPLTLLVHGPHVNPSFGLEHFWLALLSFADIVKECWALEIRGDGSVIGTWISKAGLLLPNWDVLYDGSLGDFSDLITPCSGEEILMNLKQMGKDKALGPDGLSAEFFIATWSIISGDITRVLNELMFENGEMERVNKSFIILIPKVNGANTISQFRPISLTTSIIKILSKILATKLKRHMDTLVDDTQCVFLKGRSKVDSYVTAYEIAHLCKRRKEDAMLVKLDMSLQIHTRKCDKHSFYTLRDGIIEGAGGLAAAVPPKQEKVDWLNLPCPIPFEEVQREALMSLKPELFEGLRFDFTKGLNQRFALSHSVFMGSMEVPSQSSGTIKVPTAHYEFGANFLDPKLMLVGRVMTDGRLNARVKCDLTDKLTMKINAQLTNEPHFSQGMFNFDYKGTDYRTQFQIGNNAFYGGNYIQSVSPHLSLGTEIFWLGHQRKSGIGFAARYNTDKMVATGQVASTGIVALSYVQKVSEKVSLASDFMYNHMTGDVTSSFGYDYILRQCRLRGKLDSNGVIAAYLEERLNMGVNFILSAEVDHKKKDYKFGFGMTVGE